MTPASSRTTVDIAVVCGGNNSEREVSLRSGAAIARALDLGPIASRVHLCDMVDPLAPLDERILRADVCLLALHGGYGEDGSLQARLEAEGVAYLGSNPVASRLAMEKHLSKERMRQAGVPTPDAICVERGTDIRPADLVRDLGLPLFVKPVAEGSSIGIHKVKSLDELAAALVSLLSTGQNVLVEQAVKGRELTVAVLDGVALPVVEIVFATEFFDYDAKYHDDRTRYYLDHDLDAATVKSVQQAAVAAYESHGCRHLARVDLIHDGVAPWVLEVNTLPGMTERSLLPKAAAAAGIPFVDLCAQLVRMVQRDHGQAHDTGSAEGGRVVA